MSRLRALAGRALWRARPLLARRLGLHVGLARNWDLVPRSFYSPIPRLEELSDADWERRSPLRGIELDLDPQLALLEGELSAPLAEIARLLEDDRLAGFRIANPSYAAVDAELLWAMIRHHRPRRLVELGSGNSTLLAAAACAANRADGDAVVHAVYDPFAGALPATVERHAVRAQDLPPDAFSRLQAGDILFVDTTHTVKLGGDVNAIVLDGLPQLAAGVLVHFHDIWLPFEYHRALLERFGWYWNEQYLLQAYLAGNPGVRVLLAAQALVRAHPERVRALIPSYAGENFPTAFWLRVGP